ncbi:hypothetical protein GCM10010478_26100 [Streptomyces erythrogriseus]|uniref:Uncharacterized protein n=1 Tax=Streptomyces erythrogriseus TaxID=284027 RepID=A0ABN3WTS3_9ACTN
MIARAELADALAADRPVAEAPVDDDPPKVTAKVPVAGSIVARWQEEATAQGTRAGLPADRGTVGG